MLLADVVRDELTNNIPDTIFAKIGLQLHRRSQHPIGILKNAIYEYFDSSFANKFDKFDDLCPIVSVKQVRIKFCFHSIGLVSLFGGFCDNFLAVMYWMLVATHYRNLNQSRFHT